MNIQGLHKVVGNNEGIPQGELRRKKASPRSRSRRRSRGRLRKRSKVVHSKKNKSPKVPTVRIKATKLKSKRADDSIRLRQKRSLVKKKIRFRRPVSIKIPVRNHSYQYAIRRNHHFARILGWKKHQARTLDLLGLARTTPINTRFILAIRRWQKRRSLRPTGIIGPGTWRRMRRVLKIGLRPVLAEPEATFFKDDPELIGIALATGTPPAKKAGTTGQLIGIYNRIGNLVKELADRTNLDPAAILAVWQLASRSRKHIKGKTPAAFENHRFYKAWGRQHEKQYRNHFRHGGHGGIPGKAWQKQQFRTKTSNAFSPLKGDRSRAYRAFRLAKKLAGEKKAIRAFRLGEPQILLSRYSSLGYSSPRAMYQAFQNSLRPQVLGFFDHAMHYPAPVNGDLLVYLRKRDWRQFLRHYYPEQELNKKIIVLTALHKQARSVIG